MMNLSPQAFKMPRHRADPFCRQNCTATGTCCLRELFKFRPYLPFVGSNALDY